MKLKFYWLTLALLMFTLLIPSCRYPYLKRYGNSYYCLGTFDSGSYSRGYHFPVQAKDAQMILFWHEASNAFILKDAATVLHMLDATGMEETEQINNEPIRRSVYVTLAENYDVAAFTVSTGNIGHVLVYPFDEEEQERQSIVIERATLTAWHPSIQSLAAIYHPEGYESSSNIVALFEITDLTAVLTRTYTLESIDIGEILGWSSDGQVIAVSQYDKIGLIPYYLFLEDGAVRKSLYDTSANNCVFDAQWSPTEQEIIFTGESNATEGWDIFLEEVAPREGKGGSLINLTSTPGEDERNAAWSPSGEQIVYMKGYEDTTGDLHQELFVIDVNNTNLPPIQLTDTLEEFETNPMWISDTEIAYLSWSPTRLAWSLNTISIADHVSKRLMEIPTSWYQQP